MNVAREDRMHRFPRFGRRLVVSLLAAGVIVPAVTFAQATTTSKKDSTSGDSTTTRAAAGKRARFGALGRSALSKANSAADKVAQTTGVSKETMAQAALASTGVGAAAMLAKPGAAPGGTTASKVGAIVGQTAVQRMQQEQAARAARATGAMPVGAAGMTAEQMALYRQQAAMQQAGAGGGGSAEMQKLQADYMQLVMRAQSGDTVAVKQLMRFQQEMTTVGLRMQGVAPDKQQAVYESALRDALQCATSNRQCHAGRM
jgi:hypothetical protein